jgi:Ca2+-binding EF-hand superfamily protein
VRSRTRVALTTRLALSEWGDRSDEELAKIFAQFDTSGDGALDADELKVT